MYTYRIIVAEKYLQFNSFWSLLTDKHTWTTQARSTIVPAKSQNMRIRHLDKRSTTYKEFSGRIDSLGRQACASLNGNDMLKRRIEKFLKWQQLQCNTLEGIIRDIRAEGLNSIANEADSLRLKIVEAIKAEIGEFKSRQAIGHENGPTSHTAGSQAAHTRQWYFKRTFRNEKNRRN